MSEEVKESAPAAETTKATEEVKKEEQSGDAPAAEAKKKKINKLSQNELAKKISDMDDKGLNSSKYYKHLVERQKELSK